MATRSPKSSSEPRAVETIDGLVASPRERLEVELKGWLDLTSEDHKANLAQALLALANHGGGFMVIGVREVASHGWEPDPGRPGDLSTYSQDIVNGIVKSYADPPYHCDVDFATHTGTSGRFPVISVPGGHRVPIRAKRDGPNGKHVKQHAYYIRRPGPTSEQPQSPEEWDNLVRRCVLAHREELLEQLRVLLSGDVGAAVDEVPDEFLPWVTAAGARLQELLNPGYKVPEAWKYDLGLQTFAYQIEGDFPEPSPAELKELLASIRQHTGFGVWLVFRNNEDLKPYTAGDDVEAWFKRDPEGSPAMGDFWRASPKGMFFLTRGYDEDTPGKPYGQGTTISIENTVWTIAECVLHAAEVCRRLAGDAGRVRFSAKWTGLKNRHLQVTHGLRIPLSENYISRQDEVSESLSFSPAEAEEALTAIVTKLLTRFFRSFDFFEPPATLIAQELAKVRGRK